MTEISSLQTAIKMAAQSWTQLDEPGDPNTVDVYQHAGKVVELLGLQLPIELPKKEIGVLLVESVEKNFIKSSLIRYLSSQELTKRGATLVEDIQNQRLLSFGIQECYAVALYTWHGCLNMAKLTRETHVSIDGEKAYTDEMRLQGYMLLKVCWRKEKQDRGNPWVQYGVYLAGSLSEKRGDKVISTWIPKDSPYWN